MALLARRAVRRRNRAIGPLGTATRLLSGVLLLVLASVEEHVGWWEIAAGVVVLPLIAAALAALVTLGFGRYPPEAWAPGSLGWWAQGLLVGLAVIVAGIGVTYVTPADGAGPLWVFLGVSFLIAAVRGFAGCEVLAIPNLLTGGYREVGCLVYSPIDLWEERRGSARPHGSSDLADRSRPRKLVR